MPGETDPDVDSEKTTGIALKIIDDLIKEAGASPEEDEISTVKTQAGEFVQEL